MSKKMPKIANEREWRNERGNFLYCHDGPRRLGGPAGRRACPAADSSFQLDTEEAAKIKAFSTFHDDFILNTTYGLQDLFKEDLSYF